MGAQSLLASSNFQKLPRINQHHKVFVNIIYEVSDIHPLLKPNHPKGLKCIENFKSNIIMMINRISTKIDTTLNTHTHIANLELEALRIISN